MSESFFSMPMSFEALVGSAPDAVVVHDLEDQVLYWNQAAQALYGWPVDEIVGRPVTRVFYLDKAEREEAVAVLRDKGHWSGELRQLSRNGDEFYIQSRQQIFRDESGEPVAVVCYNTNVTELKKQEDAKERAHDVRSSSILAGGVAHELNNALAPIMLSAAMLKRSLEDEKSRNMVSMIETCANKGAVLISDLLSFERGKGGGNGVIRKTQVERSLKHIGAKVIPPEVSLQVDVVQNLWECRGEMPELVEVFEHVMTNACEAMPAGGALKVNVGNRLFDENLENLAPGAKAGAYVTFVFTDDGHGIEKKWIKRVAEPFFTTKEPKQGHGFGLSNSQAIIKGHKGFMVLESDCGLGTTLSIFLPADVAVEEVPGTVPPFVMSQEGKGKLVLVADDEFFIRETIKKTLEDRGYDVVVAQDGTEALAVYATRINDIDMVVTNVEMPFMDGASLCRALLKLNPEAKILISSGHKQRQKIQEIKSCGVENFLAKPYTDDDLADRVHSILTAEG
ncbi:MAG: two-component system cell cycle sensor histidine kinase/response regulator CckA [Lentimonas sp.]|jgi:two-component system cell cycle sensor histidine kinase/response regulator CckA